MTHKLTMTWKGLRKSQWISLGITLTIAGSFALLGQRRLHYFWGPEPVLESGLLNRIDRGAATVMQRAEWATYDLRFKLRGPRLPHPDVAIIGIDEFSLQNMGQWPWSRRVHADLIRKLQPAAPKALLFDVLFKEPFTSDLAGDRELARATRAAPWTVHAVYFEPAINGGLTISLPMKALVDAEPFVGFVNSHIEEDGTLRRALLRQNVLGEELDLLALSGAALSLNEAPETIVEKLPKDDLGRVLLNYAGPEFSFRDPRQETPAYIPFAQVLSGAVPASFFKDKVVLVGASATGTYDHYPTPFSKSMPGVEVHATVIENLLRGNTLAYTGLRVTLWVLLGLAILGGVAFGRFSALGGALTAVSLAVCYAATSQWLFSSHEIVLDTAGPLLSLGLGYLGVIMFRFFTEEKEKRWVKGAFGQYVSPKVLDVLMENPKKLGLGGERREMTAFFSDVAGFTSISERLTPDELVILLNRYLTAMTDVIFQHDGYLNKYMGDGIMAFWNAPIRQPDHASRACHAALQSVVKLEALNEELKKEGLVPLRARIGINSGQMAVGNMGSSQKFDYTVMGDHVNLASRLEGANKPYGTSVMISEFTYELVQNEFDVRFIDIMRVPGKAKPVKTYELLGVKGAFKGSTLEAIPLYHEAVLLMAERQFTAAREKFAQLHRAAPDDRLYEVYLKRTEELIVHPPAKDWDGVYDVKTK
jgi:adenylate cyclase